jgi:NAD(P)-dependent dehydrogenase (short-subunit alcohol dehydrogenase family)
MIDLKDKKILVTGASSGIGRAVANLAASLGAQLVLIARNTERLQITYSELKGNKHEQYVCDITDYELITKIITESIKISGPFNGFVHCAGIEKTLPFKATKNQVFKDIFETNVFAAFEIARILTQKGNYAPLGASIVFISSIKALKGDIGNVAYCSSKSALLAGSKALALEVAPKKIRCNCVLPGVVKTEMIQSLFESISEESIQNIVNKHPLGLGTPDDIAALICFLLSDKARWITGSDYIIDGGYTSK